MRFIRSLAHVAFVLILVLPGFPLVAQAVGGPRYALVIGNGDYAELAKLRNPANDARDMAAALTELGFDVKLLVNADLSAMEDAVIRLGNSLAQSSDSMGFFFYAGHGVQSEGINYLIPADARIPGETFLKTKALPAQSVLDTLAGSRNALNVVVLDACRDNPFSWVRGGRRGLSVVGAQPAGSIIAYATSAGSIAQDGQGRNGIFTAELLKQIKTPGLEIKEVFNRTGKAVQSATARRQVPAVYNQYFDSAYLAGAKAAAAVPAPAPTMKVTRSYGSLSINAASAGTLYLDGKAMGELPAGAEASLDGIEVGEHSLELRYPGGAKETRSATVQKGQSSVVAFIGGKAAPAQAPIGAAAATSGFVRVLAGNFLMGSPTWEKDRGSDEGPQHEVRLSAFTIGKYEVTVGEFQSFVEATGYTTEAEREGGGYVWTGFRWEQQADANWRNPNFAQCESSPVVMVSWSDAVAYCNWRSTKEGLRPCYAISGTSASCDFGANGYRLPTEAEWEYAAKGGPQSGSLAANEVYAGSANLDQVAWYSGNSGGKTQPVGQKTANALGLYDMAGNVWEWCWDWYGRYVSGPQTDPAGASSGAGRVARGGGWFYVGEDLRSAFRGYLGPGGRLNFLGFRVLRRP